jgi:hypothetical protein
MSTNWAKMTGPSLILFTLVILLAIAIVALSPRVAATQAVPTTNKGWIGLQSGAQPPPGQYVTFLLWNYNHPLISLYERCGRTV